MSSVWKRHFKTDCTWSPMKVRMCCSEFLHFHIMAMSRDRSYPNSIKGCKSKTHRSSPPKAHYHHASWNMTRFPSNWDMSPRPRNPEGLRNMYSLRIRMKDLWHHYTVESTEVPHKGELEEKGSALKKPSGGSCCWAVGQAARPWDAMTLQWGIFGALMASPSQFSVYMWSFVTAQSKIDEHLSVRASVCEWNSGQIIHVLCLKQNIKIRDQSMCTNVCALHYFYGAYKYLGTAWRVFSTCQIPIKNCKPDPFPFPNRLLKHLIQRTLKKSTVSATGVSWAI